MATQDITSTESVWYVPVGWLRLVLAVHCAGIACQWLRAPSKTDSDIFWFFHFHLQWSESTALQIVEVGAWTFLMAGVLLVGFPTLHALFRYASDGPIPSLPSVVWQPPLLMFVAAWCLLLAMSHLWRGGMDATWTLAERAVGYVVPWALLMLVPSGAEHSVSRNLADDAFGLLRFAAAVTLITQGIHSLCAGPPIIDLLVRWGKNLFGWDLTPDLAETCLATLGKIDILAALLLVTTRWRMVAAYMAVCGLVTAASQISPTFDWDAYSETMLRAANAGVPLAIFFYWHCGRRTERRMS